jgi:hypothetical protein
VEDQAKFEGWAVVEIMGHQKHAGYCQTQAFGSAVLLKVTAPEVPPFETVLTQREWINGEYAPSGSRVERSRPKAEVLVGMDSIYRITPCSEETALGSLPFKAVVTFRPEVLELPPASLTVERISEEGDQGHDDDCPY